jgi:toxin ParE1/3/4
VTRKIEIRPAARADLQEIGHYTDERWGRVQTRRYLAAISDALDRIGKRPQIGSDQSPVVAGLRKLRSGSHSIYYRHDQDRIIVVRILHGRMDIGRADWPAE